MFVLFAVGQIHPYTLPKISQIHTTSHCTQALTRSIAVQDHRGCGLQSADDGRRRSPRSAVTCRGRGPRSRESWSLAWRAAVCGPCCGGWLAGWLDVWLLARRNTMQLCGPRSPADGRGPRSMDSKISAVRGPRSAGGMGALDLQAR